MGPDAHPLLDTSRLEDALGGDRSLMGEILEMYETTAVDDLNGVLAAVSAGDLESIVKRAHALKGSSGNVGANRVMDLAARIERYGRDGSIEGAAGLVDVLSSTFEQTVAASRQYRAA